MPAFRTEKTVKKNQTKTSSHIKSNEKYTKIEIITAGEWSAMEGPGESGRWNFSLVSLIVLSLLGLIWRQNNVESGGC